MNHIFIIIIINYNYNLLYYTYIPRKFNQLSNMLLKSTVLTTELYFLFLEKKKKLTKTTPYLYCIIFYYIAFIIYFKEWIISTFRVNTNIVYLHSKVIAFCCMAALEHRPAYILYIYSKL